MLDVKDFISVEVDNPLPKPFIMPTFWVPNVILSSDYLISVSLLKVLNGRLNLSIANLLTLLPSSKYRGEMPGGWDMLYNLGIEKVLADLYFTLPFDLGIVEATQRFTGGDDPAMARRRTSARYSWVSRMRSTARSRTRWGCPRSISTSSRWPR